MTKNSIYTPDGERKEIKADAPDLMAQIETELLVPYREIIELNWLGHGKRNSLEYRMKGYLDRVATMMLQNPGEHGILTERMQRRLAQREMPLEERVKDTTLKTKRTYKLRKQNKISRTQKAAELKKRYPNADMQWIWVNTEGCFVWQDIRYRIVDPAYGPIHLTSDDLYPYDRVGLIQTGTATAYYSQTLDPIAPKDIIALQPLSQGQKEDAK